MTGAGLRRTGVEVTGLSKLCHTRAISAVLSVVWPRPYVGMFTRGEQTVGKWRFVVSAVYPRCTIPENDKVNIGIVRHANCHTMPKRRVFSLVWYSLDADRLTLQTVNLEAWMARPCRCMA